MSHSSLLASNERGIRIGSSRIFTRTLFCSALAILAPALAHAESGSQALPLDIDPSLGRVDAETLRAEIHRELDLARISSDGGSKLGTLLVRNEGEEVAVVFVTNEGRVISRKLSLPEDPELAAKTLAFAASNLVRDEAADLLAKLTPAPAPEAEPEPAVVSEPVPLPEPGPETPANSPAPALLSCKGTRPIAVGVDFAPFVGTSSAVPDATRRFSFNFVGGYAKGLNGFELGIGANIESDFVCGVQIAAGANIVGGPVRGLQLANVNIADSVRGAQIGVVDISAGDVAGSQIGVVTIAGGSLQGAQIGVVGIAGGSVQGTQMGVVGIAGGDVKGTQLGVAHVVGGSIEGSQLGVVNIAGGDAKRLQMGVTNIAGSDADTQIGVANVAGGEAGVQIGVFNYADDSDASIGLLNVIRRGRTSVEAWGTSEGMASVGIRHGGRVLHNVLAVGVPFGVEGSSWGFTFGLGARVPMTDRLHLDIDALATNLADGKGNPFSDTAPHNYRLAFELGYELVDGFGVFGGPSVDVHLSHREGPRSAPSWSRTSLHEGSKYRVDITPGLLLGVRYDVQRR